MRKKYVDIYDVKVLDGYVVRIEVKRYIQQKFEAFEAGKASSESVQNMLSMLCDLGFISCRVYFEMIEKLKAVEAERKKE